VVKVRGIPFCERCAREQEVYFAIGELTEPPSRLHNDEPLVGMLGRIRRIRLERRLVNDHKPDAA